MNYNYKINKYIYIYLLKYININKFEKIIAIKFTIIIIYELIVTLIWI